MGTPRWRPRNLLSRAALTAFAASLAALAWNLAGRWSGAGTVAMALFGLTMILVLLIIIRNSDKGGI